MKKTDFLELAKHYSSYSELALVLGVSRQAVHQRLKSYGLTLNPVAPLTDRIPNE